MPRQLRMLRKDRQYSFVYFLPDLLKRPVRVYHKDFAEVCGMFLKALANSAVELKILLIEARRLLRPRMNSFDTLFRSHVEKYGRVRHTVFGNFSRYALYKREQIRTLAPIDLVGDRGERETIPDDVHSGGKRG